MSRTDLLDLDEAQRRLMAAVTPLPIEEVPLREAAGRRVAVPLAYRLTQPPFDASAMDGYAIRFDDLPGPWKVVGESAAGRPWGGVLKPGAAVRIFTGAPVPAGADTVIVQEEVERDGDVARQSGEGPPRRGAHIRQRGLDFLEGSVAAQAGERLTPAKLGLLAAGGHGTVPVRRRPRVALLATGDELVPPGATPEPGQIVSSNGVMLAALLQSAGAEVADMGIVPDRREALAKALRQAQTADLIVTIGGASVGDHDLVLPVLTNLGAKIDFWKVAIKPGKPLLAGRLGPALVLGLPGNPVSAFVCAVLFALPLLRAMQGSPDLLPRTIEARLAKPLPANGGRRDHLRAVLRDGLVTPADRQDSSMLSVLAAASALIVRPEWAHASEAGDMVSVIPLELHFPS